MSWEAVHSGAALELSSYSSIPRELPSNHAQINHKCGILYPAMFVDDKCMPFHFLNLVVAAYYFQFLI